MKFDNFYKNRLVEDAAREIATMKFPAEVLFEAYITYNEPSMLNKWLAEAEVIPNMIRTPEKRKDRKPISPQNDFLNKYWNSYDLLVSAMNSLAREAKLSPDISSLHDSLKKITNWMASNDDKVSKVYQQIQSNVMARLQPMRLSQEFPVAQSEVGG